MTKLLSAVRGILFVHLSPADQESGGTVDSRNTLLEIFKELLLERNEEIKLHLLTNDKPLLENLVRLIPKKLSSVATEIRCIHICENPLYSWRLFVSVVHSVVATLVNRHNNIRVIYLLEEYPNLLLPVLIIATLFRKKLVFKLHSFMFIHDKKLGFHSALFRNMRVNQIIMYLAVAFLYGALLRIFSGEYIVLLPNRNLRRSFLKKSCALYVSPGNFLYLTPMKYRNRALLAEPYEICIVSSKFSAFHLLFLNNLRYRTHYSKILLLGTPMVPFRERFEREIREFKTAEYIVPESKEHLFIVLSSRCSRVIYITFHDTWSYMVYESLLLGKEVVIKALNRFTLENIISAQLDIFGERLDVVQVDGDIVLRLKSCEGLSEELRYKNRKYVKQTWLLMKKLLES